jgi:hypothetical protein
MTQPQGATAFLALWNSIDDAARQAEYEVWHSFEHVPERVSLPGFISARRWRSVPRAQGAPLYFTLYWLEGAGALDTEAYRAVFAAPTRWTERMRGHLTEFLRMPCELQAGHGLSTASRLVTLQVRAHEEGAAAVLDAWLAARVQQGDLVCAHWGRSVETSAIPIANAASASAPRQGDLVVLLQGLDGAALQTQAQDLLRALGASASALRAPELFELLTEVRRDALPSPLTARLGPRNDLFQRFAKGDTP